MSAGTPCVRPDRLDEFEAALAAVESATGVRAAELLSQSRVPFVSQARQDLMLRLRRLRTWSLQDIGRAVGGRHHATVIYGLRQAARRQREPAAERAMA